MKPYDANAIADAVAALARAVFTARGRIAFGGHPTITPLILLVASSRNERGLVDIFQSDWFRDEITPETQRLEQLGYGIIHWAERRESQEDSLRVLRLTMIQESNPLGAIFIGGMDGLFEEFELFHQQYPNRPCIPVKMPGGAAQKLDPFGIPLELVKKLSSPHYPALYHSVMDFLAQQMREQ